MENGSVFVYLSIVEGFLICCMLGWEVYWLRRMYKVLQSMPTGEQLAGMIEILKKDRDMVKESLENVVDTFMHGKEMALDVFKKVFLLSQK
jgi:hypothetical protein